MLLFFESIALISKLSGAVSGLFVSGHEGISVGHRAAGTAIDNNFLEYAAGALFVAYLVYDELKTSVEQPDAIVPNELGNTVIVAAPVTSTKALMKGIQGLKKVFGSKSAAVEGLQG